jgi:hypothetical protein
MTKVNNGIEPMTAFLLAETNNAKPEETVDSAAMVDSREPVGRWPNEGLRRGLRPTSEWRCPIAGSVVITGKTSPLCQTYICPSTRFRFHRFRGISCPVKHIAGLKEKL